MKRQIPRGDEDLLCPFWQKPQSEVCHKCPLWVQIKGKDPQSEQEWDQWGCSFMFMPKLVIEGSQMSRQTGAAVESFRNEMVTRNDLMLRIAQHQMMNGHKPDDKLLIGGRHDDDR